MARKKCFSVVYICYSHFLEQKAGYDMLFNPLNMQKNRTIAVYCIFSDFTIRKAIQFTSHILVHCSKTFDMKITQCYQ